MKASNRISFAVEGNFTEIRFVQPLNIPLQIEVICVLLKSIVCKPVQSRKLEYVSFMVFGNITEVSAEQ